MGNKVDVVVTATNAGGSTQAISAQTATVASPQAPSNSAAPAISGQAVQGQTLNASSGSWNPPADAVLRVSVAGLREFLFEHLGGDELVVYAAGL